VRMTVITHPIVITTAAPRPKVRAGAQAETSVKRDTTNIADIIQRAIDSAYTHKLATSHPRSEFVKPKSISLNIRHIHEPAMGRLSLLF